MITKINNVSVYVSDQQRAKAFYTEKLGMNLVTDAELYHGAPTRWIAVALPGAQTHIILYVPDENWEHYRQVIGKSQNIVLDVTDMASTAADLKAKGVTFLSEPDPQPWGTYAMIEDSEGNGIMLVEQPTGNWS